MSSIKSQFLKLGSIEEREYQLNIVHTATNSNTLCVLPTGTGKTAIAILLSVVRLQKFPSSKIMIVAPTKPLCAQHQKSFQNALNLPEEDIILLTGQIPPSARIRLYEKAKIISATPQTIENDID